MAIRGYEMARPTQLRFSPARQGSPDHPDTLTRALSGIVNRIDPRNGLGHKDLQNVVTHQPAPTWHPYGIRF